MKLISDGGLGSLNDPDTIDAIMLTKNISYIDGVKLDVRMTYDNYLVLARDNDLSKFTLSNKKVNECNYSYLRRVKFPSHIFKYFIPTLNEVLLGYNKKKIVVLEIYEDNNIDKLLNLLYNLLVLYDYNYYFISKSFRVLDKLKDNEFNKIGQIINDDSHIKVFDDSTFTIDLIGDNEVMLISKYPEKIKKKLINFDKDHNF